ncbi:MAG: hypothetical protein ABID64_00915 [Nitrospirota bacterium]
MKTLESFVPDEEMNPEISTLLDEVKERLFEAVKTAFENSNQAEPKEVYLGTIEINRIFDFVNNLVLSFTTEDQDLEQLIKYLAERTELEPQWITERLERLQLLVDNE